ncbi:hypothetical protein ACFO0S_02495 [Chryseomicrobium palamuruense]|uniref:Uncharacterized protein n=1 Tax=Chryseomicrobium palamuruense TaxID=682973 RepID=A0ABV8UT67_9BACL
MRIHKDLVRLELGDPTTCLASAFMVRTSVNNRPSGAFILSSGANVRINSSV